MRNSKETGEHYALEVRTVEIRDVDARKDESTKSFTAIVQGREIDEVTKIKCISNTYGGQVTENVKCLALRVGPLRAPAHCEPLRTHATRALASM